VKAVARADVSARRVAGGIRVTVELNRVHRVSRIRRLQRRMSRRRVAWLAVCRAAMSA
jgi:hypothetical protein